MGKRFRSFDEAWSFFLSRQEALETLGPPFRTPWTLAWLLPVEPSLVPRLLEAQAPLVRLPFLRLVPESFLHVTVALAGAASEPPTEAVVAECVRRAEAAWHDVPGFDVAMRRVNCFHDAVVVEVEPERWDFPSLLVEHEYWRDLPLEIVGTPPQLDVVLPHVTLALTEGGDPDALRDVVLPLRDVDIGSQRVTRVELCLVPTASETFLDPWHVVGAVELRS